VMGFGLLLNVLTVAILSTPTPLRVFMNEPANVWITQAPFVWLVAVLVPTALAGHLVIFRRLRSELAAPAGQRNASDSQARRAPVAVL
jgi:hypothetical protein